MVCVCACVTSSVIKMPQCLVHFLNLLRISTYQSILKCNFIHSHVLILIHENWTSDAVFFFFEYYTLISHLVHFRINNFASPIHSYASKSFILFIYFLIKQTVLYGSRLTHQRHAVSWEIITLSKGSMNAQYYISNAL